jgi:hypothetical protein
MRWTLLQTLGAPPGATAEERERKERDERREEGAKEVGRVEATVRGILRILEFIACVRACLEKNT